MKIALDKRELERSLDEFREYWMEIASREKPREEVYDAMSIIHAADLPDDEQIELTGALRFGELDKVYDALDGGLCDRLTPAQCRNLRMLLKRIEREGARVSPSPEEAERQVDEVVKSARVAAEGEAKAVLRALQRAAKLADVRSPITLKTTVHPSDVSSDALYSISHEVEVGDGGASFTIFPDRGKMIVDDVLDAGDRDFFRDDRVERDYFALVKALRNPSGLDKVVTVYTARPSNDREKLLSMAKRRVFPARIFVTTDPRRAEGFAREFRDRDLWRLKIKSKYLVNTLDAGRLRDYQLVPVRGDDVPIEKATLL